MKINSLRKIFKKNQAATQPNKLTEIQLKKKEFCKLESAVKRTKNNLSVCKKLFEGEIHITVDLHSETEDRRMDARSAQMLLFQVKIKNPQLQTYNFRRTTSSVQKTSTKLIMFIAVPAYLKIWPERLVCKTILRVEPIIDHRTGNRTNRSLSRMISPRIPATMPKG